MSMGTSLRSYSRGHTLVSMQDGVANATRYYHFDHQGTTQCLTNEAGAVTDRFASDAWGVEVKRTGNSINRHWYVGDLGYQTNRQVHVRARLYKPTSSRWLSRAVEPRSESFVYSDNSPVLQIDPSGRTPTAFFSASGSGCHPKDVLCRCGGGPRKPQAM
jgi:RHS repeat-associated protein